MHLVYLSNQVEVNNVCLFVSVTDFSSGRECTRAHVQTGFSRRRGGG